MVQVKCNNLLFAEKTAVPDPYSSFIFIDFFDDLYLNIGVISNLLRHPKLIRDIC